MVFEFPLKRSQILASKRNCYRLLTSCCHCHPSILRIDYSGLELVPLPSEQIRLRHTSHTGNKYTREHARIASLLLPSASWIFAFSLRKWTIFPLVSLIYLSDGRSHGLRSHLLHGRRVSFTRLQYAGSSGTWGHRMLISRHQ